jgi:hypothetical protein
VTACLVLAGSTVSHLAVHGGGASGFDLLDHKPALEKHDGKRLPGIDPFFGNPGPAMRSPYEFYTC